MSNGDKGSDSYLCPFNKFSTSVLSGVKPLLFLTICSFVIALFSFHMFISFQLRISILLINTNISPVSSLKSPYSSKIDILLSQERFNKLIYGINTIIKYGT